MCVSCQVTHSEPLIVFISGSICILRTKRWQVEAVGGVPDRWEVDRHQWKTPDGLWARGPQMGGWVAPTQAACDSAAAKTRKTNETVVILHFPLL